MPAIPTRGTRLTCGKVQRCQNRPLLSKEATPEDGAAPCPALGARYSKRDRARPSDRNSAQCRFASDWSH